MLERDLHQIQKQYEWPENYYMETDAKIRKSYLQQALDEDPSTENQLRKTLWDARYTNSKGKVDGIDHFMKCWIDLSFLPQQKKGLFGEKKYRSSLSQIIDTFHLKEYKENEQYKDVWYQEFLNFFCFYIQISMTDKSYSTSVFGVGKLSQATIANKIANDFCERNTRLPKKMGFYEEMSLIADAGKDAYSLYFPEYAHIYEEQLGKE